MFYKITGPGIDMILHQTNDLTLYWQAWGANYWVSLGAPKDKLVIGLATYGRSFTLSNAAENAVRSPASGPATSGDFTREAGFFSYYEVIIYKC